MRAAEGDPGATETRYLDLDGDDMLDAVEFTRAVGLDVNGDGVPDIVSVIKEVDAEIDDDGVPKSVVTTETLEIARAMAPEWSD